MKRSDTLPSASRSLQAEVGVTEFSAVPTYNLVTPVCPQCGILMVGRVARQGKNAGQAFSSCKFSCDRNCMAGKQN